MLTNSPASPIIALGKSATIPLTESQKPIIYGFTKFIKAPLAKQLQNEPLSPLFCVAKFLAP